MFGVFDALGYFVRAFGCSRAEYQELETLLVRQQAQAIPSDRSLSPLATLGHEAHHCFQIAGTPFGQLWTRALLTQALAPTFVFQHIFSGREMVLSMPLDRIWTDVCGPDAASALTVLRTRWASIDALLDVFLAPATVAIEIACRRHVDAWNFIREFGYMDRPLTLRPPAHRVELISHIGDMNATPCDAQGHETISTRHLLEGHARMLEVEFLRLLGDTAAAGDVSLQAAAAQATMPFHVIGAVHGEQFENSDALIATTLALIELALFAPVDPALQVYREANVIAWEVVHPAYRFVRAAHATLEVGLLPQIADIDAYQSKVCSRLGWYTPRDIAIELIEKLGGSVSVYDHAFVKCLEYRLDRPHAFAAGLAMGDGFTPPLVLLDDGFFCTATRLLRDPASDCNDLIQFHGIHTIGKQLLFGDELSVPALLDHARYELHEFLHANFGFDVGDG